ncbi:peptidylprolyl isomerase [Malassezia sp. CBS 17886]|nr:peptidylprolyl isomerase [Malassezia sp. CBS 17886]
MRYVGKLQNGSIFDSNTKGRPFSFRLGKGEVIKGGHHVAPQLTVGWDEGVKGMQVGAERRLVCPPHLAYGRTKLPGIPSNSTLIFDVKLLETR